MFNEQNFDSLKEHIKRSTMKYLTNFRIISREESDYLELATTTTNQDQNESIIFSFSNNSVKNSQLNLNISIRTKSQETTQLSYPIKELSLDSILVSFLAILAHKSIINPILENHFLSNHKFENHFSILILNKPKISFTWFINDVIFILENKKPDVFGKPDQQLLSVEHMNQEKGTKEFGKSSKNLDGLFSNQTTKFVHFMDLNDSIHDSENDYLNLMILSKNKSEKYNSFNLNDSKIFTTVHPNKLLQFFLLNILSANSYISSEKSTRLNLYTEYEISQVFLKEFEFQVDFNQSLSFASHIPRISRRANSFEKWNIFIYRKYEN